MFEKHFQLQRRPFSSVPNSEYYFPASTIENARESLVRLTEREDGPAIVVGPVGIGKTLLSQLVTESFRHRCRVVRLPNARLSSRRALLQVVLYELGLPYRDLDEGEARLALTDHVTNRDVCPEGVVLLVDEAECLSMALLDELRTMTNLMVDGRPCIRLLLFGNRRLEEKFAHPKLESFNQRLAGRFYLEALTQDEVKQYVTQQILESGGDPVEIFTDDAMQSIAQATEGIPRLVNQLCGHALILAAINGVRQLDGQDISEAWADLQQLPAPQHSSLASTDSDSLPDIVEFGQLDEPTEETDEDTVMDEDPADFELQTETTLSEIEGHLALTQTDTDVDAQMELEATSPPEIELIFHDAHTAIDPFEETFEEEEVVIDDYLRPSVLAEQHRAVTCDESVGIANQLREVLSQVNHAASAPSDSNEPHVQAENESLDDSNQDVISFAMPTVDKDASRPEQDAMLGDVEVLIESEPSADSTELITEYEDLSLRDSHPSDSQDNEVQTTDPQEQLILPEDSASPEKETPSVEENSEKSAQPKADRNQYRNLFTRLRHSKQ